MHRLLFVLPLAHSSCKFLHDIAYGRWCRPAATNVPPLDHVSVRRRAKFFFILTDQTATTEQGITAGYFSHEGSIIAAASKMALLLLSKRTSTNG